MNTPTRVAVGALAAALLAMGSQGAWASSKMLSDAKKASLPAKNCQYCHTEAVPKKETYKPENLNERGKFVLDDKQKRSLKVADPSVLKNFPGGADKK